jgi:hypothetical protein
MANIRYKARLERLRAELAHIAHNFRLYGTERLADAVDHEATYIAEEAAKLAADARALRGDSTARRLVRAVRKALGFTYP